MEHEVAARYCIKLRVGEVEVAEELLHLLEAVEARGSLLGASRSIGMPYSRAWDMVVRAERLLGARLVETQRGGRKRGGTRLTPLARSLLNAYRAARSRLEHCLGPLEAPRLALNPEDTGPPLVLAYSSDPLLEAVIQHLRGSGVNVDAACVGSGLAAAMLSLGEADAACMHLYDPETGLYNRPFLERSWVENPLLLGGYMRQLVMALRPGLEDRYRSLESLLEAARRGDLSLVARNRGSGTAHRLSLMLGPQGAQRAQLVGPVYTHDEAARLVAAGRADAALVVRTSAERYGLPWIHVAWERYECYTTHRKASMEHVRLLGEALHSKWLQGLLSRHPGYRPLPGREEA